MATRNFADSRYRYTNPIRYFKENDPIHYSVDNIPLTQLQENDNFLKDQIESLLGTGTGLSVKREEFDELKPYVEGADNVVKVRPGRFTARINDAYRIDQLQYLERVTGLQAWEGDTHNAKTVNYQILSSALQKFKQYLASNALGMNGLVERAFTYAMQDIDMPAHVVPNGQGYPATNPPPYPALLGKIWKNSTNDVNDRLIQYNYFVPERGFFELGTAESDFIKRWRGVARTALVNVEEELEIEIPAFDENDFFYIDEQGTRQTVYSTQRIDLLYIYSKPVDTSSTTIAKFVGNNPTTILKPQLGLVQGAGLGMSFQTTPNGSPPENAYLIPLSEEGGNQRILANPADELAEGFGFSSIRGSFPSPDDLMNISPLLVNELTSNDIQLIGQTILPVAYVVVKRTAGINSEGRQIVTQSDIIDIRPFFRTTELSYNERSGIAAATPQLSLANPAASEGYVDLVAKRLFEDYQVKIGQISNSLNGSPTTPRIVATGYIKGGFNYGVESVLGSLVQARFNVNGTEQQKQQVIQRYGYPAGTVIPDLPEWDISEWCNRSNLPSKGQYPNDYINFHTVGPAFNGTPGLQFGAWKDLSKTERVKFLGVNRIQGQQSNSDSGNVCIYFVKKSINIDRSLVPWMRDYHVDAQLWNCAPLSCNTHKDGNNIVLGGNASIWIDKRQNSFTIYVSWVAADQFNQAISAGSTEPGTANVYPHQNRGNGQIYAGFSVINNDFLIGPYSHRRVEGESDAGVAIYPTVSFQIHGIPDAFQAGLANAPAFTQSIVLR